MDSEQKIKVGVGAVIVNDEGKILLQKRALGVKSHAGMWDSPGGGVEFGETFAETIRREVREEHGVEVEIGEILGIVEEIDQVSGRHVVAPAFLCRITAGTPQILEPEKCEEIGWFTWEEAQELPLSPFGQGDLANFHRKYPNGIL